MTNEGDSIQSHLNRIFNVMILHYPNNSLERFEEVSYLIKNRMDLKEYLKIEEIRTYSEVAKNELEYVARATKFFPKTSAISGEEGGEEADAGAPIGTV